MIIALLLHPETVHLGTTVVSLVLVSTDDVIESTGGAQ